MNRLAAENPRQIAPESLPPAQREPNRSRLLFITSYALGFKTLARQLEAFTAGRDDVDAVHLRVAATGPLRYLNAGIEGLGGWDFGGTRSMLAWKLALDRLFGRRGLDVRRFDAALVTTQTVAPAMLGIKRRTGLPFAVYVDTTNAQFCRELGGHFTPEAPVRAMERRLFGAAAFVAGMSQWTLESVAADYAVPRDRLQLVHNAVPIPPVAAIQAENVPERRPRIVFVGNDWLRKGGDRLLAWHQARWADRAELHIISTAAPVDNSARSVIWHGAVPNEKLMSELLPSMDLFALPTRADMSPWAAIEASAIGLPVVSSRLGGLGEIVLHERTGLLCPPGDDAAYIAAIERLMADPALRRSMSVEARRHMIAEFSPEKCYGGLVDRMIASARPRE